MEKDPKKPEQRPKDVFTAREHFDRLYAQSDAEISDAAREDLEIAKALSESSNATRH